MAKEIIACQLSYIPIESGKYSDDVEKVLEIIQSFFPDCEVGEFSTIVKGTSSEIMQMLDVITVSMNEHGSRFSIQISLSNTCGCTIK